MSRTCGPTSGAARSTWSRCSSGEGRGSRRSRRWRCESPSSPPASGARGSSSSTRCRRCSPTRRTRSRPPSSGSSTTSRSGRVSPRRRPPAPPRPTGGAPSASGWTRSAGAWSRGARAPAGGWRRTRGDDPGGSMTNGAMSVEAVAGAPGEPAQRLRLLFAAYMAGGNATILANLKEASEQRPHATSWAPIDLDAESKRYKHGTSGPRALVPGTFRNSMVTARFIREMERDGPSFDAAWFFQQTICMFLWRFRRRVPHVVAMDGTPLWYARHGLWYAQFRFDPSALREKIKYLLTRQVYQQAFHLLPPSTGVRDALVEDYGAPPERIPVVPPGVNLRRFTCPDRGTPERLNRRPQVPFVGAD